MIIWALWSKWYDYIGDPTLADAIMARLAANASKIELKSDSMRQKKKNLKSATIIQYTIKGRFMSR